MHKPAQLTFELFALLILALIATGHIAPAKAQLAEQPGAPTTTTQQTTNVATPEPLVLTSAADSELKLTATPIRIGDDDSLRLKPGEKKQVTLKVYNTSKNAVKIRSLVEDFVIGDDGATPTPVETAEADNRWSLKNWITVAPNSQTIKAGETGAIGVLIEVPEDALPGGHYAMVLHQPDLGKDTADQEAKNTAVTQRVGTLIYVVVDGPILEEAFIRNFTIPQFQDFGPVPYSFDMDNNSDIHIQPKLTFNVYNIWGKRIHSEPIESKNIFPKDSRSFTDNSWDRVWGLGRYKGEIVAVYGSESMTNVLATTFWLFPLKLVLAIGVAFITLIAMIISIRRHMIHRSENQSKRVRELEEKVAQMEQEKTQTPQV